MFLKTNRSGLDWIIKPGFEKSLPAAIPASVDDCRHDPQATLIRDNNVRMSFFYRTDDGGAFHKALQVPQHLGHGKIFFLSLKGHGGMAQSSAV